MIDLDQEMWSAVESVRQSHLNRLGALGVPRDALAALGAIQPPLGLQRVARLPDGLYEPDPDGEPAAILPVCEFNALGFIEVVDLLAWNTSQPSRWNWRVGQGWALGSIWLDVDEPVPVVPTPLDWLKAGGEALCILDWSAPAQCWARLRTGPPLKFTDEATRQMVRNKLVETAPMPVMEVSHAA